MKRRCFDVMDKIDRTPCCEMSKFPFEPEIFDECLLQSISSLYQTPREFFIPGIAGPKFSHPDLNENLTDFVEQPIVKALIVEYDSTQSFTMSYTELDNFVFDVQSWLDEMLKTAPDGMKSGWFTSELDFYDLQETLSTGTITAIFMSMSVALIILLLVTLNVLISLYAIITVTFTIFTTVAILVLLDWKLNILESIAVSTTIGLAVDFSLHYGVHYRLSPEPDRKSATKFSLQRMLAPTTMAAITTGAAGAFMIPSSVLAYIQIGIFLVVVMSVSWFYSTFYLMSLLSVIGPQYGFGQFRYPKFGGNSRGENTNGKGKGQVDCNNRSTDNHGTVSEQLLSASSSAAGELVGSESHELDALTSNSVIKSALECSRPINFDRAFKKNYSSYPKEQSPSTISSITVVLPDDGEIKNY